MDMYEEQLKDFVEKQHFRYDRMQTAFAVTKNKWKETNDRLKIKLRLLEFTISFYMNVKQVNSHPH